jgi:D-amino-acid oxidase
VAKHMPGDYDIEYTSPWAGADYFPWVIDFESFPESPVTDGIRMAKAGTIAATLEHDTWPHLAHLAKNVPEAGVHFQSKQ